MLLPALSVAISALLCGLHIFYCRLVAMFAVTDRPWSTALQHSLCNTSHQGFVVRGAKSWIYASLLEVILFPPGLEDFMLLCCL